MRAVTIPIVCLLLMGAAPPPAAGDSRVAGHEAADAFDEIPASYFPAAREHFRFLYGHTSHGSQVVDGMAMLASLDPALHAPLVMTELNADLGAYGDTTWVSLTREHLAAHPECNAVMWAWCSGLTINTPEGVDAYLEAMDQLESQYPGVTFVYMTGHLDGTGLDGLLHTNNDRIRAWCVSRGKRLYDFADIESWNPDGEFFPDEVDACEWCGDWCATHDCPPCDGCAHSHCFNCWRKGRAFWWLLARELGWAPAIAAGVSEGAAFGSPARPNPFARSTTLAFALPVAGDVRLSIVDTAGRLVATLADGPLAAGRHEFTWTGRAADGTPAPPGVYFARRSGAGQARTERLVLLR